MTANQLIAVAAFVVSGAITLLVAHLHRKQMQQNELFRQNPSVGVRPPPSPPMVFFKQYWDLILGLGVPILFIGFLIAIDKPATAHFVVLISYSFACIVYTLNLRSERRLLKHIDALVEIDRRLLDIHRDQLDIHEVHAKTSQALLDYNEAMRRIAKFERQKEPKEIAQNTGQV